MISLGHDYAIRITTDLPIGDDALHEAYHAVNAVLGRLLTRTNYDVAVVQEFRAKPWREGINLGLNPEEK